MDISWKITHDRKTGDQKQKITGSPQDFFFSIPHGIVDRSPSAIFDGFINLYMLPKMKPSQTVEKTYEC